MNNTINNIKYTILFIKLNKYKKYSMLYMFN